MCASKQPLLALFLQSLLKKPSSRPAKLPPSLPRTRKLEPSSPNLALPTLNPSLSLPPLLNPACLPLPRPRRFVAEPESRHVVIPDPGPGTRCHQPFGPCSCLCRLCHFPSGVSIQRFGMRTPQIRRKNPALAECPIR